MNPLISIIIPIYNNEKYLNKCIESIERQDFRKWEAIFIDDASTDGSSKMVEQWAKKDCRISLFHNKGNQGAAQSRKNGLDHARGTHIMFLDGDDMLDSHALSALWQGVQKVDACIGQHYLLQGNRRLPMKSRTPAGVYYGKALRDLKNRVIYSADGYSGMSVDGVVWKALFNRKLVYDNLIYVDSKLWFSEDHLFFTAIMMDVSILRIVDEYVYYYRKHSTNVTVCYRPYYFENSVRLYHDFRSLIKSKQGMEIMQKTNEWFFLKNVEHSIKKEVLESGKNFSSCKFELKKIRIHPLVQQLMTEKNLSVLDRSGQKYLKLLRKGWFRCIYIKLKWKTKRKYKKIILKIAEYI